jgi:hypothetical protein
VRASTPAPELRAAGAGYRRTAIVRARPRAVRRDIGELRSTCAPGRRSLRGAELAVVVATVRARPWLRSVRRRARGRGRDMGTRSPATELRAIGAELQAAMAIGAIEALAGALPRTCSLLIFGLRFPLKNRAPTKR